MDKTTDTSSVNFRLSQVDRAFSSRSYDVFSCLDSIEARHKAFEKNQSDDGSDLLKPDPADEPVARKARFKIPKGMPRKSRLPDYRVRPDKWKTYSLVDVSSDQMSELSNRRTALDFVESLKSKAAGSCPDATDQMDDDSMDTCTDTSVGQSGFASHKKHLFQKRAVQSSKQIKDDENQSELKAMPQNVDVGPNLWMQQTRNENEEASCESINDNLSEDAMSSVDDDDALHLPIKGHFQNKGMKCKSKHIRPRNLEEENEEDNESLVLKDKDFHEDNESDKNESDESDEFSDCAVEDGYSDEELPSGFAESEHDRHNWSDLHHEEQDNSNDGDSINSNSCSVLEQGDIKGDIKLQNLEKDDDECADDLDGVD